MVNNLAQKKMKKILLISLGLALGLSAYASSDVANSTVSNGKKSIEITKTTGKRYQQSVKKILSDHTAKIVHVLYDEDTNKIIIDGTAYSWSHNPKYGKEGAGQAAKYKYVVAGCYYFNWEYLGNGRFKQ